MHSRYSGPSPGPVETAPASEIPSRRIFHIKATRKLLRSCCPSIFSGKHYGTLRQKS